MPAGRPPLTARWAAAHRTRLARTRPSTPTGDVEAERRLDADVRGVLAVAPGRPADLAARTRATDAEVARALGRGTRQVVLLGAGYDGRALRFGGGDTVWFEVDLPATLADKRRRLGRLGIEPAGVRTVGLDLRTDDAGPALDGAGHDAGAPSLFVAEGLFSSLTLESAASLCHTLRARAPEGSTLVATFVEVPDFDGRGRVWRGVSDVLLRAVGEPRHTYFAPGDPEKLMAVTGWHVVHTASPETTARGRPLRRPCGVTLVCEPEAAGPPRLGR